MFAEIGFCSAALGDMLAVLATTSRIGFAQYFGSSARRAS